MGKRVSCFWAFFCNLGKIPNFAVFFGFENLSPKFLHRNLFQILSTESFFVVDF
jgi:hypothetical protein